MTRRTKVVRDELPDGTVVEQRPLFATVDDGRVDPIAARATREAVTVARAKQLLGKWDRHDLAAALDAELVAGRGPAGMNGRIWLDDLRAWASQRPPQ